MIRPETIRVYDAIITARTVEPTGTPPSVDPALEKYDAVAVNTADQVRVVQRLPDRRISFGARVIPANVGDPCKIKKVGGNVFLYVTEGIPFVEACP